MDDAVIVQVLHAGQDGTGDETKPISLLLLSPAERTIKHTEALLRHLVPRNVRAAEALKELAANSELESEVVFCPILERFVEFDLQKDNQTC